MLPSILYIFFCTLASSFFSIYGLIFNNTTMLLVSKFISPTSKSIYNIIKSYFITKKINLLKLLTYLFIGVVTPIVMGVLFGYVLEEIIKKYYKKDEDSEINIPSNYMKEKIKYNPIKMFFNIVTPIIVALFLPYALETNNTGLLIAISIALSCSTPLATIGLFIGSNHKTEKNYGFDEYIIPFTNFLTNLLSIILISIFMIGYLGFDKK